MPKVMLTGHRPKKLGGYEPESPLNRAIQGKIQELLIRAKNYPYPDDLVIISGMAIGCDQWWAEIALDLGLEVHAYIPFIGQESRWPPEAQAKYQELLKRCKEVICVSSGPYFSWKLQKRNRAMVDASDLAVAIWDGSISGTGNCISYLQKKKVPYLHVHPATLEDSWINP